MTTRIDQLKWLLVDAIYDLVTPATVFREYHANKSFDPGDQKYLGVCRMCNSHAIIALAKLDEAINHFGKEIQTFPEPLRSEIRAIKVEIEAKGVYKFRSKYVAHSFSEESGSKAPLQIADAYPMLEKVVGASLKDFYQWIAPQANDSNADHGVVSVVVKMRDHCASIVGLGKKRL